MAVDPSLLEWAEYWYPISWKGVLTGGIITAVGACATIAFLLLQWRTTTIREEQSDWRTSVVEADTAKAKAELGTAQADIAKANAQIAEANAQTKEAELKLEQLRKLASPRGINHPIFEAEIKGKPKAPVVIWYMPDSSDGWQFAFQLQVALMSAEWEVAPPKPIPEVPQASLWRDTPRAMAAGGQPSGVTVVGTDYEMNDPAFKALYDALAKSNTEFATYGSGGSQALPVPTGTLRVVIAGKIDPIFTNKPQPAK